MNAMENAYGLVVGIANYKHINGLPLSVLADARDIHEVLTNPNRCAYPQTNVELLVDQQATREGLTAALQKLAQRCNGESTAFFYISGHGHFIKSGPYAGEYLLPVDTCNSSDESIARTSISGIQFTEMLRAIPARKVVVIFDTCYSGGVGEPKEAAGRKIRHIPESFYETLATGRGRVIVSSSLSTEVSYVFPDAANSLFTQHTLAGLRGGAPASGGVIRIFNLFDYLQPRVTRDCPHQHPFFKAAVEENFPVALHLGGKIPAPTIYQTQVSTVDDSSGKAGRIIRQLDLLLGTEQKLAASDRTLLFTALSSVIVNGVGRKDAEERAKRPKITDEVKEVIDRSDCESGSSVQPCKYPQTELLCALLKIGLRLGLRRKEISASDADQGSWDLDDWVSYLTDEIVCERGLLRYHLIAPGESWVEPLIGATAVATESLWQQLRAVLTRNDMSFAVSRPHFEIDSNLSSIPKRVLKQISEAAKKAKDAWPKFPHLGERPDFPVVEELLPLPETVIRCPVVFKGRNGCPVRLLANGIVIAEKEGDIEYWPPDEQQVECVLECDEGAGFIPLVQSRLQRLYAMETEILKMADNRLEACQRLGLRSEVLQILWPRIIAGEAEPSELASALHILRDAWVAYEKFSLDHSSLLDRYDVYWDAMELIRKQMTQEK